ncbi:hypothetical protein M9458_030423, partial [Cirrhinus mrigala]
LRSVARGAVASSSSFVHHGLRNFQEIDWPGILACSRLMGAVRVWTAGSAARHFGALDPSTLPSWTHEDTRVHARERNLHFNSGGDEASTTPGCFGALPLSHTHSRREPVEWWRLLDRMMMIIKGEAADLCHIAQAPPTTANSLLSAIFSALEQL